MRRRGWLLTTAALLATLPAACGPMRVGVAEPEALLAWAPRPTDPAARITTVKVTAARTYVGLSDGEKFFKPNAASGWSRYDTGPPPCNQPTPAGPVTAFAVTEDTAFAAHAGTRGAFGIWRSPADQPCWALVPVSDDIWNLSVSPFSPLDLLAVSPGLVWASPDLGGAWTNDPTVLSLGFAGAAQAMASGVSPAGGPRAWVGDDQGRLFYSDDVVPGAPPTVTWTRVQEPRFPARPVVAVVAHPDRPTTIWITFAGLQADSLWTSDDDGLTWRNPHGGELAADAPPAGGSAASFTAVSPIPGVGAVCVTALVPDAIGNAVPTTFWSRDGTDEWWKM